MKNWTIILLAFLMFGMASCDDVEVDVDIRKKTDAIPFVPFTSISDLAKKAERKNKNLLVVVQANYDGPSKWMESSVYTDTNVIAYYDAFYICSKVNVEDADSFKNAHDIQEYPTFLFFDKAGELMHRVVGAAESMSFIEYGVLAKDDSRNLRYFEKKYQSGTYDQNFLRNYAMALYDAGIENVKVVNEFMSSLTSTDYFDEEVFHFLMAFLKDVESPNAKFILKYKDQFIAAFGEDEYATMIYQIVHGSIENAGELSEDQIKKIEKFARKADLKDAEEFLFEVKLACLEKTEDWEAYGKHLQKNVTRLYKDKPSELNRFALEVAKKVKDQEVLKEAEEWMKKAIQLDPSSYNLENYSKLLLETKQFDKAAYAVKKAIETAKDHGESITDLEDLEKKIKKHLK